MPAFGMPGVSISPRGARRTGLIAAGIAAVLLTAWRIAPLDNDSESMTVTLVTEQVGDGVEEGSDIRLDGVKVGKITAIATADIGRQRITLQLNKNQLFGLTDTLSVAYAPGNLFGISELALKSGSGGTALTENAQVDLTGRHADRVVDATISTVLQSVGQLTNEVLTPQLATVLSRISTDLKAFTPLIHTIVVTSQLIADTQRLPSSFLLEQYGSTLQGLPPTPDGLLRVLDSFYNSPELMSDSDRARFDASVVLVRDQVIAALPPLLNTAQRYSNGYTDELAPLLTMIARALPPSDRSTREISELLDRLRAALPDTPHGPVLRVDLDLRGVPGMAVPLLQGLPAAITEGVR
ncbi:MlaD family protein [Nocardia sp. XZ_19_385]|uniref:MlaD family protein n=1 Tax=Nocardia sp. XZ_19_385 TaxID=2769488 RepID=UPI00188F5F6F|nr:MlaD family protein [Nocardia sp. XZ_19_385]